MVGFRKLALVQAKLYLREPMAAFFTLAFGPLMVGLLGFVIGNNPDPMFDGRGFLDRSVPGYMAMVLGIVGLTAVPIGSSLRREQGVLRRFSATPLRPVTYFLTDVLVPYLMTLLGMLLVLFIAAVVFRVRFEGSLLGLLAAASLGTFAFFALGYALAGLVRSSRAVTVIGNVLVYPMTILSGATVPLEVMPDTVRTISRFVPLTPLVTLVQGIWYGESWGAHATEAALLAGMGIVGTLIVARTFHWE